MKVEEVYKSGVERLLKLSPYNKNVFIMTPFRDDARYRELIRTIKDELSQLVCVGGLPWITLLNFNCGTMSNVFFLDVSMELQFFVTRGMVR